jgi:hypothetical protein
VIPQEQVSVAAEAALMSVVWRGVRFGFALSQEPRRCCTSHNTTQQTQRKCMTNYQFDDLAKGLAQSVTRRQALRIFACSLAGMALTLIGMTSDARAAKGSCKGLGEHCSAAGGGGGCCPGLVCVNLNGARHSYCVTPGP